MIRTAARIRSGVSRSPLDTAAAAIPNTGTSKENGAITDAE
jgi:hypothetical protein